MLSVKFRFLDDTEVIDDFFQHYLREIPHSTKMPNVFSVCDISDENS